MASEKAQGDNSFSSIRVATLRGDLKIPFDVFVRVAGKHILYCRHGDSFEGKRLDRLKAKRLRKMYIRNEDDVPYRQYLEESIDSAYNNKSGKDLLIRAEVIQGFQQAAAEQYMEDPLSEFSYRHARSSVQRFCEFLVKEPNGARALLELQNTDQSITHHGVTVATLSLAMTLENGVAAGIPVDLLALGCMLHDIDHFFDDTGATKSLVNLSEEALRSYREHPLRGAHRLQSATFVDQLVLSLITQHEENAKGTGFPKGLHEREMDPLVMVAATANAYDRLICFENMKPKDALKNLLIDKLGLYPLKHLQTLQNLLKRFAIL